MDKIIALFQEFGTISVIVRIILATVIGGLIGAERGRHGRPAGLRTHILVCIGAAMTSLTSLFLSETLGYMGDVARLSAQVISGIGFLGAGTIMIRNSSMITGLTTAAGMWATATIGIAVGYGFYVAAIVATLVCIFCVSVLNRLERQRKSTSNVYVELTNITDTEQVIEIITGFEHAIASYDIIPAKSGHSENVGIIFTLHGVEYFEALKKAVQEGSSVAIMVRDVAN